MAPSRSELVHPSMTFEDWALQRILSMDTPGPAVGKVGEQPQDLSSRSATRPNRLEATDAPIELDAPPEPLAEATMEVSNQGLEAPLIDQIGAAAPDAIFVWDREIRIGKDDRVNVLSAPPSGLKQHRTAIIAGTLLLALALGLGWLGRSNSNFFDANLASPTPKKPTSSDCTADPGKETICVDPKSDRLEMLNLPNSPIPAATRPDRAHDRSTGGSPITNAVSLPKKQNTVSLAPTAVGRAKLSTRPVAVPETRPTTIEGWTVRDVIGGRAVLEGPNGIRNVTRGDIVPGVGKIDSILRWGNRWIVATDRGLISTR
jgi:hypothetical protein